MHAINNFGRSATGPDYSPDKLDRLWRRERLGPGIRRRTRETQSNWDVFRQEFHVETYPPPPSEPEAKVLFDAQFIQHEEGVTDQAQSVSGTLKKGEMVLWFNLEWPISLQLENAKHVLQTHARDHGAKSRRNRKDAYKNYLRVLDAKAAGVSNNRIASELYPKLSDHDRRQRVRDDLKAAHRLRDHDYWLIAVLGPKVPIIGYYKP